MSTSWGEEGPSDPLLTKKNCNIPQNSVECSQVPIKESNMEVLAVSC